MCSTLDVDDDDVDNDDDDDDNNDDDDETTTMMAMTMTMIVELRTVILDVNVLHPVHFGLHLWAARCTAMHTL